jgi:hypothetical protein
MRPAFLIFIISIFMLTLCACSTMQPIDTNISQEGLEGSIAAGDKVVIYTKGRENTPGGANTVIVESITNDKIVAKNMDQNEMEFYFSDIKTIEKDQFSARETAKGAGAVALYTLVLLATGAMYLAIGAVM